MYNENTLNKESEMQYLITDPCYIVPNDEWSDFCDKLFANGNTPDTDAVLPYTIEGFGKITHLSTTANGDGSVRVPGYKGRIFEIGVDAGLVCIAEVSEMYKLGKNDLGALSRVKEEALYYYEEACTI